MRIRRQKFHSGASGSGLKAVEIGRPYGRKLGGTGFDVVAGVGEEAFVQTGGYGDDQQPPRRSPDISKRMGQVRGDIRKLRLMINAGSAVDANLESAV
jgi:hypothetical protein